MRFEAPYGESGRPIWASTFGIRGSSPYTALLDAYTNRFTRGQMDLVTDLADETDAHQPATHASDLCFSHAEIGKRSVREIEGRELAENGSCLWTRNVERCEVARQVHEADGQAPPRRQAPQLAE